MYSTPAPPSASLANDAPPPVVLARIPLDRLNSQSLSRGAVPAVVNLAAPARKLFRTIGARAPPLPPPPSPSLPIPPPLCSRRSSPTQQAAHPPLLPLPLPPQRSSTSPSSPSPSARGSSPSSASRARRRRSRGSSQRLRRTRASRSTTRRRRCEFGSVGLGGGVPLFCCRSAAKEAAETAALE